MSDDFICGPLIMYCDYVKDVADYLVQTSLDLDISRALAKRPEFTSGIVRAGLCWQGRLAARR